MEHGETTNRQDINKWIVCHNLFNMGVFSYKQPNKKDNTTANGNIIVLTKNILLNCR